MTGQLNKAQEPNSGKYSELPLRMASAIVLAAFALFCTWMGGFTFLLLAMLLSIVIFAEFTSMVKSQAPKMLAIFAFCFLILVFAAYILQRPTSGLAIICFAVAALAVWELLVSRSVWGATALAYCGLPFIAFVEMRNGTHGLFVILFVFACVWGADTLAYFFGKTLGGPKLAPTVSPNKTWSGFVGGFVGAVVLSSVLVVAFGYTTGAGPVVLAIVLAFASQLGDLFESWIKRRFGHKDSGKIIPGHGGLLDRIDGLIFAIVVAWLLGVSLAPDSIWEQAKSDVLIEKFVK